MRKVVHWIDDEIDKLKIIVQQLQKQNIIVRTYNEADEFFKKYHPSPIELILIDYFLDENNMGIDILKRIRQEKIDSRVVVVSGMLDVQSVKNLIFAGASDIIEKNSPITMIREVLKQVELCQAKYQSSKIRMIYNTLTEKQKVVCDGMINRLSTNEIVQVSGLGYSNVRKYKSQIFEIFRDEGYVINTARDISKIFTK
ncbi:response regulator [Francisella philomiragia]|uniref:Response regulator receiver protein n=1 Tax=Francisella philomiragia subsp. philomiragia (strain ATCC 25017 / CCUG 19701 / FSC 153 / O\|nr:response regulator [Francisella philomiragia]AJI46908.1 response regulator [Francisella philomiragia]AJI48938.1 response regulator [Francisella philomiragia]MBK2020515.1 response regulator [Francisella philomiragia]MBK2030208.1 response regulator [Francisella philomiragia]MBK2264830.1 response regulator [Francisella philomiragia]